jgi:hypothetical protein
LSRAEGVGHRKLSAIIRVGHVKICRRLGPSHFFVLKISAQRTRYLFFGLSTENWYGYINKIKIKSLESNCNVLVQKLFLPKKVVNGGGGVGLLSENFFSRKNWKRGGS